MRLFIAYCRYTDFFRDEDALFIDDTLARYRIIIRARAISHYF